MLIQQKESCFTLAASILFLLLKTVLPQNPSGLGMEFTLLLLLLFIITLWTIRHFSGIRLKALDEMDLVIRSQAAIVAAHGFGAVVMIFAFVLVLIHRDSGFVPLQRVFNLAYYSWMALYTFWSAAILILYKTGAWHVN